MPVSDKQRLVTIMHSSRAATLVSLAEVQQMASICIDAAEAFALLRQACFEADMQRVGLDPRSLSQWLEETAPKLALNPVPKEACNGPEH